MDNTKMRLVGPDGTATPEFTLEDMQRVTAKRGRDRRSDILKPDPEFDAARDNAHRVTQAELRAFVERIERLAAEKADISDGMKAVYAEAKSRGYDTKALRKLVALRTKDPAEVAEEQAILDLYIGALVGAEVVS